MFYHQIEQHQSVSVIPTTLPADNEMVRYPKLQRAMYPFSRRAAKIIEEYQIEVPFKIVSLADGISKCTSCGQAYSGCTSHRCDKIRTCTRWRVGSSRHKNDRWDNAKPTQWRDDPVPELVKVEAKTCDGSFVWHLEGEYNRQKSFFEMIERLPTRSELLSFGNGANLNFKAATTDPMLQQQLQNLAVSKAFEGIAHEFTQIGQVINEIVNRLNNAGSNLQGYY